jgi:hypothetical protein
MLLTRREFVGGVAAAYAMRNARTEGTKQTDLGNEATEATDFNGAQ